MAVAVVVATRDRPERLAALMESLRRQTFSEPFEIVVVDDGSVTDLPALEGVKVIRRGQSAGPAVARNEGWRACAADLVVFTDDDCVATPGWLESVVRAALSQPGAIVQGRVSPMPDEIDRDGPFSRTLRVDGGPWYQTCNIAYPRAVLESLGGFDGSFARAGEDTDLAWRALARGERIVFAPDALVHHAVERLGPVGMLRVAWRWSSSIGLFGRHPELRRTTLEKRIFWKGSHYLLVRALLTLVLPRRLWGLAAWLWLPYAFHLVDRWREDGAPPALAPWYVLHDLVELAAVARGAIRSRVLVL